MVLAAQQQQQLPSPKKASRGFDATGVPTFRPGPAEVLGAVESLYADQVRPQGRLLLKRLGERAAERSGSEGVIPRIDQGRLRRVCDRCRRLQVRDEDGGEYVALFADRMDEGNFVDLRSSEDRYPQAMWAFAALHFGSKECMDLVLPGGRYACAQALQAHELPFLAGRSLGELCHIVQLAISQKRILGYLNGHVVPFNQSEAVIKERCASKQLAVGGILGHRGVPALPTASLQQVRSCLTELLQTLVPIPLPNVKRLFRSKFQLDLSETALGHSRLCELLHDERLADICQLRLQGCGYMVEPSSEQLGDAGSACDVLSESTACVEDDASLGSATISTSASEPCSPSNSERSSSPWTPEVDLMSPTMRRPLELQLIRRFDAALVSEAMATSELVEPVVKNTFLHFEEKMPDISSGAKRRTPSAPASRVAMMDQSGLEATACHSLPYLSAAVPSVPEVQPAMEAEAKADHTSGEEPPKGGGAFVSLRRFKWSDEIDGEDSDDFGGWWP